MPTIARARPLTRLPEPTCPAALPIAGATSGRAGVVCRVIEQDREREAGLDMNPAQLAIARRGGDGDVFLTLAGDPSTVERLCCGAALPVLGDREVPGNRASYTYCPVWQAEKARIDAGREMLSAPEAAEPVAHFDNGRGGTAPVGSSYDSPDPWAQARRDLDVLAPPKG